MTPRRPSALESYLARTESREESCRRWRCTADELAFALTFDGVDPNALGPDGAPVRHRPAEVDRMLADVFPGRVPLEPLLAGTAVGVVLATVGPVVPQRRRGR